MLWGFFETTTTMIQNSNRLLSLKSLHSFHSGWPVWCHCLRTVVKWRNSRSYSLDHPQHPPFALDALRVGSTWTFYDMPFLGSPTRGLQQLQAETQLWTEATSSSFHRDDYYAKWSEHLSCISWAKANNLRPSNNIWKFEEWNLPQLRPIFDFIGLWSQVVTTY